MPQLLFRKVTLDLANIDTGAKTIPCVLSSETPVVRDYGLEVLEHSEKAVDLSRAQNGLTLLWSHDVREPIGRVVDIYLSGKKLRGKLISGNSHFAKEKWVDILDGILTDLSVGYTVEPESVIRDGDTFLFTRWCPFEVSSVAIGADPEAGTFRHIEIVSSKSKCNCNRAFTLSNERKIVMPPESKDETSSNQYEKRERFRVKEILAIGKAHNYVKEAHEAVLNDVPLEAFRQRLLDRQGTPKPIGDTCPDYNYDNIGLSHSEVNDFSIVRALRSQMPSNSQEGGLEREASRAVAQKLGRQPQGIFIPNEILAKRDLSKGVNTAGGYLVGTDHLGGSFIDVLRNYTQVINAGATVLSGLRGDVSIPKQAGPATAYWVAEGISVTKSDQVFSSVNMAPKSVGAMTEYSRKMLLQASPDVENLIKADLAQVLALEIDRAAINGSGISSQPMGLLNTTGIGNIAGGTNGLAPGWSHIVNLTTEVANSNANMGNMGFLTNSKVRGKLLQVEKATGTGLFVWEGADNGADRGEGRLAGFKAFVSNNVPSNLTKGTSSGVCSAILYGNWADLIIGQWSGLDLLLDPYTLSSNGGMRIRVFQDIDIAVRHPESFAVMLDALTV